jgi:hypothetical protein
MLAIAKEAKLTELKIRLAQDIKKVDPWCMPRSSLLNTGSCVRGVLQVNSSNA